MTIRRLTTTRQSIGEIAEAQQQRVRMGVLVAPYPGTGDYMHVQMTNPETGASTILRARVLSGITTDVLPVGTPVSVTIRHAQPQVVGVAGIGSAAGSGGSGGGTVIAGRNWVQFVDDPLTSLDLSGSFPSVWYDTWSAGVGYAIGIGAPDDFALLTWYSDQDLAAVIVEAEVSFPTGSAAAFGICVGFAGLDLGYLVCLDPSTSVFSGFDETYIFATSVLRWGIPTTTLTFPATYFFPMNNHLPLPGVVADTFYTLRAMRIGSTVSFWLNDSFIRTIDLRLGAFSAETSNDALIGAVDGVNDLFVTSFPVTSRPLVMKNSVVLLPTSGYAFDGSRGFTLTTPPAPGDVIVVAYERASVDISDVIGLWAANGEAHFRNVKAWRLALPEDVIV